MLVGEAPGLNEDKKGEPFVGAAGNVLTSLLNQIGLTQDDVFIANVLKCRPPGNRDPEPEEIEKCAPFLHAQIFVIKPKVIIALGRFAGGLLTNKPKSSAAVLRSQDWVYENQQTNVKSWVVMTYHPAWLIYQGATDPNHANFQMVLEDLKRAIGLVDVVPEQRDPEPDEDIRVIFGIE
jgi:uracil-DNA glycosylase family 4